MEKIYKGFTADELLEEILDLSYQLRVGRDLEVLTKYEIVSRETSIAMIYAEIYNRVIKCDNKVAIEYVVELITMSNKEVIEKYNCGLDEVNAIKAGSLGFWKNYFEEVK